MSKSRILEEKPSTPIANILQTEPGAMEFYTRRQLRVADILRNFPAVDFHRTRLGRQSFCWTGVHRYWIWDLPPLRLFVNNQKGIGVEVDPTLTVDEALDNFGLYEEILGISYKPVLRLSEEFRLEMEGRNAARGHEMRLPRMDDKDLREFVISFSNNTIWTSRHIRGTDIGMVFMPVAFGCMSIPEKVQKRIFKNLMDDPGPEPECPDKPKMDELPEKPEKPEKPEPIKPDPEVLKEIKMGIDWQDKDSQDIASYKAKIEEQNAELQADYEAQVKAWQAECAQVQEKIDLIEAKHKAAMITWETVNSDFPPKHAAWVEAKARWDAVTRGVGEQYLKDFGCVWADTAKHHTFPRSVNGYPIFSECCLMHQEDFNRAMQAIELETKRRENITV